MFNLKSPSVQTFIGGLLLMLAGKYLLAGIDTKFPIPGLGDVTLQTAAMLLGFGGCAWAIKNPTAMVADRVRKSMAPPPPVDDPVNVPVEDAVPPDQAITIRDKPKADA